MCSPFLDPRGETIPLDKVLGNGSTAVVLQDGMAVKTPLRYVWSSESDVEINVSSVRRAQDVYRRLHSFEDDRFKGVVHWIGFTHEATQLAYMPNGDLHAYFINHEPIQQLQLAWFQEMARTLAYIHNQRVLVADLASQNFLIKSDLSLQVYNFRESTILPLDADMKTADNCGYTAQVNVGFLGTVMHEIITGNKYEFDLFKDNAPTDGRVYFPQRMHLQARGLWLGGIIEGRWNGRFHSADSLLRALESVDLQLSSSSTARPSRLS